MERGQMSGVGILGGRNCEGEVCEMSSGVLGTSCVLSQTSQLDSEAAGVSLKAKELQYMY